MYNSMNAENWFYEQIEKTQIVVMAGGKAKRMAIDIPKCLLEISGKKLIDMCIESLTKEGFRDFVFLLGHKHETVAEYIGNCRYNISSRFSIDPPRVSGWGKGKAFKYALVNEKIDGSKRSIVVFPDDIILEEKIFSKFLLNHVEAIQKHSVSASVLLVPGAEYPYAVADVDSGGLVHEFTEKPFLNKPTSAGVYIFEPDVYGIIRENISIDDPSPVDLESTIMPRLVANTKLSSFFIPTNKWMPINTIKEYENAIKVFSKAK